MNLDDIDPNDISSPLPQSSQQGSSLSLSQLGPNDVSYVAPNADEAQYGTPSQQALAGAEGFGRGATLGASGLAETALGLTTPEAMAKRAEVNPWTAGLGTLGGGAALIYGTGGAAAPIAEALGGGALATGAGLATEGGLFGLGNVVSDLSMGDPNINAQKILTDIGMGSALGVGLGALGAGLSRVPALFRATKAVVPEAAPVVEGAAEPIVNLPPGKKARTIEELRKQLDDYKKNTGQADLSQLPSRPEAVAAAQRLEDSGVLSEVPINQMQLDALNSQDDNLAYKTKAEVPGEEGQVLRDNISAQKHILNKALDNNIQEIAPGYEVTNNAAEAGQRVSKILTDNDQAVRESLAPAFEQIKATPLEEMDHLPGVIKYLTEANPDLANIFDTSTNEIKLKPNNGQTGIADTTYRKISSLVDDLQENPKGFEGLKNLREKLTDGVDIFSDDRASKQLGSAKAAMMEYMQDAVQNVDPDLEVRETFKKWAINEQNKDFLQDVIKAKVGSNWRDVEAGKLNPDEAIIKKIFSNSALTDAVKSMMSPEQFSQTLADHMAILKNEVTKDGAFSANQFSNKISKGNQKYALENAFQESAPQFQKMQDILTTMRAFTDYGPINPSGTAKTLLQAIIESAKHPSSTLANFGEYAKAQVADYKLRSEINNALAGVKDQNTKLKSIQGMINRVNTSIKNGAKAIFSEPGKDAIRGGLISSISQQLSDVDYDKHVKRLREFSAYPEMMMDHLAENTEHMNLAAPNITQSLNTSVMSAVGYLNSKVPKPMNSYPLSQEWKPSSVQKAQFNRYYQAVNDPTSVLKEVKNGTLTQQTMEALTAVHPQLLDEMRKEVGMQIKPEKAKALTYAQKVSLSKFMGQPMDGNMVPSQILSNQLALNANLSQQSLPKSGRKTSLGGLKQLNLSTLTKTRTQAGESE